MRKNRIILLAVVGILAVVAAIFVFRGSSEEGDEILISPKAGKFEVRVTTTGELQAKNSIDILGPSNARNAGIWQMKIQRLIPEGTVITKGSFVAELDRSEISGKLKEVEINLQKFQSQYTQAQLDCTLTLSQSRDELINLKSTMEQRETEVDLNKFEAPAIQKQAKIEYEKAIRALNQAKANYETKVAQARAKMQEVEADLSKEKARYEEYIGIAQSFTINAPENGMVIYAREWDGKKKVIGSSVSSWQPVVATLPDLSVMESKTYVNEVDIQKIKMGQLVEIRLDADPDKKLSGEVTHIANIGEQLPNTDSKVFEVKILVQQSDSTLRPAMTTSNSILTAALPQAIFVPLECIHNQDSITYVYAKVGKETVRKEVRLGLMNENEVVIESGLNTADQVFLSKPEKGIEAQLKTLNGSL